MSNILIQNVTNRVSLSQEEQQHLISFFSEREIKKREFLLREGEISRGVAFVTEGILRSYAIDRNGFEHVIQFAPPDWWMVDMYSFVKQKPARLFIDALENTKLLWLSNSDVQRLCTDIPRMDRFFRILAENSVISYQNRLIENLGFLAAERYKSFCEQYPSLIECLPQKQVASYIGVTPEFLSKMLGELRSGKM